MCGGEIRRAISIALREKQFLFPDTLANNRGIWSEQKRESSHHDNLEQYTQYIRIYFAAQLA